MEIGIGIIINGFLIFLLWLIWRTSFIRPVIIETIKDIIKIKETK